MQFEERHDERRATLPHDLSRLLSRRRGWLALAGAGMLTAAGLGAAATRRQAMAAMAPIPGASACTVAPEETAGPFPADGSNSAHDFGGPGPGGPPPHGHPPGPPPMHPPRPSAADGPLVNVLASTGIVRSDIRSSFGGPTGRANGLPLTLTLQLVNAEGGCGPLGGYAVYVWHCDRDGRYSMYASEIARENYLRGVQETDSTGSVTFETIFPACYAGRMPHIHVEVYRSLGSAAGAPGAVKTTQIALPVDTCAAVYAKVGGYESSMPEFDSISFAADNVFSDGVGTQLATLKGDLARGYAASLTIGIAA